MNGKLILAVVVVLLSGCVTKVQIARQDEVRKPVKFESDEVRVFFNCALTATKDLRARKNEASLPNKSFSIPFVSYTDKTLLSEGATFNEAVSQIDSDQNGIILGSEVNAFYKSYFPTHKYPKNPQNLTFDEMGNVPLCNIK